MATIDEFVLKNIGLWWRYGISRHCDEWKYIIIGRIFESEIILIPPSLKISESSSNGSYRNTDEVWWRYGTSRSCDEWYVFYTFFKSKMPTPTYNLLSSVVVKNAIILNVMHSINILRDESNITNKNKKWLQLTIMTYLFWKLAQSWRYTKVR